MLKRLCIISLAVIAAAAVSGAAFAEEGHGGSHDARGEATAGHASGHGTGINWWKSDTHAPPVGWLIIDFAVLFGALYFLLRRPLSKFLAGRRATMAAQIEEAAKIKAEIDAKHKDLLARLAAIDQTVKDITQSFASRGETEKQKLIENAQHLKTAIEISARETIDREVAEARARIRDEVTRSAAAIAEDLLRKHLGPEDNERFIREFVDRLSVMKTDGLQ
ncbi:MAG: ATP synthase F0 subunit B [Deltaproteobacteria bacterium]|nr:ATP synthase F0 subunit B [Deltaproteobacteria bacterium]